VKLLRVEGITCGGPLHGVTFVKAIEVSDEDYESLSQLPWRWIRSHSTAECSLKVEKQGPDFARTQTVRLDRLVYERATGQKIGPPHKIVHADGDSFNCQRDNLKCEMPKTGPKPGTQIYYGLKRAGDQWLAEILVNRKREQIGTYPTRTEAATAYNKVALEKFGKRAKLNPV
jgi:hypothetical protein